MKRLYLLGLCGALCAFPLSSQARTPAPEPKAVQAPMNEISGTITSIDSDTHVFRLLTDNGFTVQFSVDRDTVCKGIGAPQTVANLVYKDKIIVRYAGRDLIAREIEKRNVQPAVAASSPSTPTN
jgi:hypothetical protein